MLTQKDIDNLKLKIQNGETPTLFYVCDYQETRDNNHLNAYFKTNHDYKVLEIKIKDIHNAYYEYLDYINNPNNYHTEDEIEHYIYTQDKKFIRRYIVKNPEESYTKEFNPRIPSSIYGEKKIYDGGMDGKVQYVNPTPIKPLYTNKLEYGDLIGNAIIEQYEKHNLDWKYMHLEEKAIVDGIEFEYLYTDWYYLETINFPTIEYPLINVKNKCSYFLTLEEAWEFVKECEA